MNLVPRNVAVAGCDANTGAKAWLTGASGRNVIVVGGGSYTGLCCTGGWYCGVVCRCCCCCSTCKKAYTRTVTINGTLEVDLMAILKYILTGTGTALVGGS